MSRRLLCVGEHIEVDICKSVLSEEGGLTATQRDSAIAHSVTGTKECVTNEKTSAISLRTAARDKTWQPQAA